MISPRIYQLLAIACPAFALAAGALLWSNHPEFAWPAGAAIVITLGLVLHLTRPVATDLGALIEPALSAAPSGCLGLDLDGFVQWSNAAAERTFGADPGELTGKHLTDLMAADAWTALQGRHRDLMSGAQVDVEGNTTAADGPQRLVSGSARLLRDGESRPRCILVHLLDNEPTQATQVTEGAQEMVSVAEARLHLMLGLTSDLIISLDSKGRTTHANPRASDILLAGRSSLLGTSIVEFLDPKDRGSFIRVFAESRGAPGAPRSIEKLKVQPGGRDSPLGSPRYLSVKAISLPGAGSCTMLICRDITDEKESRQLLRSSEARFSRIFHSSPDAILIVRYEDSVIVDFNPSFTRLFGYSREDAIGMPESEFELFVDPADRRAIIEALKTQGECNVQESRLRTADGQELLIDVSVRYVEIDGELCTMCICRDVSKRVLAEQALRESEHKFERIFSESPDGIVIVRQDDLTIYDVNSAFSKASGYTREELIGRSVHDFDAFANSNEFAGAMAGILNAGRVANQEMSFRTRSGTIIPSLLSATLIELQGVPYLLCIAKDIQDLRQTEQRLKDSERRFRGAFENAPIGILLVNDSGRIFEANRFAADLLAYDNASTLENVHISRLIPAEDRSQFKDTLDRIISGHEETLRTEKRMLCQDGLQIWTNFHMGFQRGEEDSPPYCILQIADITEMKNSQRRIERMAFYDTLTDLANRRLFFDRLGGAISHAQRSGTLAALLYLDLDQFKRVNDTLGHEMGDVLLQEVATRLSQCVRSGDTVGRPGGDEFTILLTDIRAPTDAGYVAEKVLEALRSPINLSGHQIVITTSIGITIIPEDGTEPNVLTKNADLAMYRAKEHGRNNYQFYSEEMNTNAVRRLRTEYELRRALERSEFELFFQPKVRLEDRQLTGVECLIRWRHPERGLLAPDAFIDVAEENGAIIDIGRWVISQACEAAGRFSEASGREIEIAINISPRQFKDPNLVANIRRAMRESGMNPGMLEIEITETMLMGDIEAANQTVQKLHEIGVKLAIDDFGTGYSSLNYLKKFPINTVKVDRSFITDIPDSADDCAITAAVIAMAHQLNMEVVAEGVESKEQLTFLQEQGCEYAQGYLFSKPVPLSGIGALLAPKVRLLRTT